MAKIRIFKDEILGEGHYLKLLGRRFVDLKKGRGIWEMVQRKNSAGIVAMAAVTPEKELILVRIFRVPICEYVLELPSGIMDKEGESPKITARRELLEETGYEVEKSELILRGPFDTGIIGDIVSIYLGTNAKFVQEPWPESTEDITVLKIPPKYLGKFIEKNQNNIYIDVKVSSVLDILRRRGLM